MDYQALKLDDPGGTVEAALSTLSAMTTTRPRSEYLINERSVYAVLGGVDGEAFLQTLEGIAQSADPMAPVIARVESWFKPGPESGVDICNGEVQMILNGVVGQGSITQQMVDDVVSLSTETVPKYPGLKITHIEKARAL